MISRRALFVSPLLASSHLAKANSRVFIDTHIHLFAADTKTFPFHKNATYKPAPSTLEDYKKFVTASGIRGAVIVHPEPYQDDHSYLEYCFRHEPSKDFFRGTVLFDPLNPQTPKRISEMRAKWPRRITALRIHRTADPSQEPSTTGAIRDRDLDNEELRRTVRALPGLGVMLQMHCIPAYAPHIARLAEEATGTTVIVDHLCRAGQGSEDQWQAVLRLARKPNIVMKISGLEYSSKEPWPYRDVKNRVRQVYDSFGASRLIWGGLGMNMTDFKKAQAQFDEFFDFCSEPSRDLIRGLNAEKLYSWKS